MTSILHLVDCLSCGGGCRAMIALAKYSKELGDFDHKIVSLKPVDPHALQLAQEADIPVVFHQTKNDLNRDLQDADIVRNLAVVATENVHHMSSFAVSELLWSFQK